MAAAVNQFFGKFRFPGNYAFFEKDGDAGFALIQFDNPFTGRFDQVAAENTSFTLQATHQEGDAARLEGTLLTVSGRDTPVLFYLREIEERPCAN